jgi:hypothetical protein
LNLKRIASLWTETAVGTGERPLEPSEARFRVWVLTLAFLIGPPLLLLFYYKAMFPGLTNSDALDYAQLGRNLSMGQGFQTNILRPLALTHGMNPLRQPDLVHGPLYPFLLALLFGVAGAKDTSVALLSGLFYLLTIPVLYAMGVRIFNRAVGLLAVLTFALNARLLEYAASGLPITLDVFLMTSLLLTIFGIATRNATASPELPASFPKALYVLAGLLTGLLYLADPIFVCIVPPILIAVVQLSPQRKTGALVTTCAPMLFLMLPWMARNLMLTGNPVFGLRGAEIWMDTRGYYDGLLAYREFPSDVTHGVGLFKAVIQKLLLRTGGVIQTFPQVTASWMLAFFLPCLLFRFTEQAANVLRQVMMGCFFGIFLGTLALHADIYMFVAVIPTMLVFSVAYLLHLIQQAKLPRATVVWVTTLMVIGLCYPLVSDLALAQKVETLKEAGAAKALGKTTRPDEVVLSDQPWIVAWYADRPSIWIPAVDARIADVRRQFPTMRRMFLTDQALGLSSDWPQIYQTLIQWNEAYFEASDKKTVQPLTIGGKGHPLVEALSGFTVTAPAEFSTPTVVVAALPAPSTQEIGLRPEAADAKPR